MQRVRSIGFACALALSGGCSDEIGVVSLSGLEGSLVVLARVSADLSLIDAKLVDPQGATFFAADTGDSLHAFALDRDDIRDIDGRPLDDGAFRSLSIDFTREDDAATACAPCPVPADAPPFVLEPASACALPSFFEHRQSTEAELGSTELRALEAKIRLVRPGACTCPKVQEGPVEGAFEACDVEPGPNPQRWHHLAVSDDGGIAAVHPSAILTATAGAPAVFHPLDMSFIGEPILSAIGSRGRRFFAVGQTLTVLTDTPEESFVRLDGDAIQLFDPLREHGEVVRGALYDPTRSSVFLFGPSYVGNEARLWRCDEALENCGASELPRCGPSPTENKNLSSATLLPSGDIVSVTLEGNLYALPAGSDTWQCRMSDFGQLRLQGPLVGHPLVLRTTGFASAVLAGDRLFTCGQGGETGSKDISYAVVINARVNLAAEPWHDGELSLWVDNGADAHCQGLWVDRTKSEVLAFFFERGAVDVAAFDLEGRYLGRRNEPLFPDFDERVALISESPDHHNILIAGADGGLRFSRDGGPLIAVDGDAPREPAFAIADVAGAHGALIFGGGLVPMSWNGGCDAASLEALAPLDRRADAIAPLEDGRVVLLSKSEVAIYDRAIGVTESWSLALPEVKAAAAITAEDVVVLDVDGGAHVLSLSMRNVRALRLESAPGVTDGRALRFTHLSGAHGVGWLSAGLDLARVRRGPDGLRAELWWGPNIAATLAAADEPIEVETYAASSVLCSGRAVISVRAIRRNLSGNQYLARTILLEPTAEHDYHPRLLPGFSDQTRFGASSFSNTADLISASANPVLVFGGGMLIRPDSEPYFAPTPDLTSVVEAGAERVVVTDRSGLRVFLKAPRGARAQ